MWASFRLTTLRNPYYYGTQISVWPLTVYPLVEICTVDSMHKSILLVDDEPMLLEVMVTVLEAGGYQCLTAGAGFDAIELYRKDHDQIAAVVLDLGLPDCLGQNVFKAMKEINPLARIIVASGAIDPDVQSELTRAGCEHFVEKPYNISELLQALKMPPS